MKKGRFLWSAHRITEKQKAGKARNIKEKQLKNSRNQVSKQLVEHHSSQRDNYRETRKRYTAPGSTILPGFSYADKIIEHHKKARKIIGNLHVTYR